ncbi:hypothetical protein ACFE04_014138 [Oxalis oulophora]
MFVEAKEELEATLSKKVGCLENECDALREEARKLSEAINADLLAKLKAAKEYVEFHKRFRKANEEEVNISKELEEVLLKDKLQTTLLEQVDFLENECEKLREESNKLSAEKKDMYAKLEAAYESLECYKRIKKDYEEEHNMWTSEKLRLIKAELESAYYSNLWFELSSALAASKASDEFHCAERNDAEERYAPLAERTK